MASWRVAREAAIYFQGLCSTILNGVAAQMKSDHLLQPGRYGARAADDDAEAILHCQGPAQGFNGRCRDDLTGQVPKDSLAIEARMVELAFFPQQRRLGETTVGDNETMYGPPTHHRLLG